MFHSRSFFFTLLFSNLLLIAILLGIGILATAYQADRQTARMIQLFQEQFLAQVQSDLQESWPDVATRIRQYNDFCDQESVFRLTVINSYGHILGDSKYFAERMEPHHRRPEILAALAGKRGEDLRKSITTNLRYRYLAEPVLHDGQVVAAVRVAFPVDDVFFAENRSFFYHGLLLSFFLIPAAAALFTLLLNQVWYRPLRILNDEARRIAEGNLEPSTPIDWPLEMTQLSQSLGAMRQRFSTQLDTITHQREGLQTILQHLPDSIFAINRAAQVIYFNKAARQLFRLESHSSQPYLQELVRNATIVDWYLERRRASKTSNSGGKIERKEVVLFGRKRILELEYVETENSSEEDAASLLIVNDLTDAVRANKMKADFVANASHELRTPLAAILAALGNVTEDVFDDRETLEKIIRVVDRQASRLDALMEDLLALHGTEDETVSPPLEETSIAEQQSWIEELFYNRIEEKRLVFSIESDFSDLKFRIDNKRLGLILQNLIDNAIKFTPVGGKVSLCFTRDHSFLFVICRDTGCGIAIEEQQRVFERFYQGDSSKTGDGRIRGTGLGLAIVKHAVERLRGSVSLESRVAYGSVFTIRIPVSFEAPVHAKRPETEPL